MNISGRLLVSKVGLGPTDGLLPCFSVICSAVSVVFPRSSIRSPFLPESSSTSGPSFPREPPVSSPYLRPFVTSNDILDVGAFDRLYLFDLDIRLRSRLRALSKEVRFNFCCVLEFFGFGFLFLAWRNRRYGFV